MPDPALTPTALRHYRNGEIAHENSKHERAKAEFEAALALAPKSPSVHYELGRLASEEGKFKSAETYLRKALQLDPTLYAAWDWLTMIKSSSTSPQTLASELDEAIEVAGDNPEAWLLYFARGRVRERLGDFEGALEDYAQGNRLPAEAGSYSQELQTAYTHNLIKHLNHTFVTRRIPPVPNSPRPIFICGMPRSGTTLVETILAAHPEVQPGGEINYIHEFLFSKLSATGPHLSGNWLSTRTDAELATVAMDWYRQFSGAATGHRWITDKTPVNFTLLGLIHVCFPDSPIVHVYRDARDTCLSCFATPFAQANSFSRTLADIEQYYRLYKRLMQHWKDILGSKRIIEVEYEKLVREPESEIKRLLAGIDLTWNDRCLTFHKAEHPIRTPSVAQVRSPIYTNSIGRWQRFEKHLPPLFADLEAPLITSQEPPAAISRTLPEAQSLSTESVDSLLNRARSLRASGKQAQALACFERAHQIDPDNLEALVSLANALLEINRGREIISEVEHTATAQKTDWNLWMLLGECREQIGSNKGALEAYTKACQHAPAGEMMPHLTLAKLAHKVSDDTLAKTEFEATLSIDPASTDALLGLAYLASEHGDFEMAETHLRQAIALEPDLHPAWYRLSALCRDTDAQALTNELEAVAEHAGDAESAWLLHFALGRMYETLGRHDQAFAEYASGNRLSNATSMYSRAARKNYTHNIITNLDEEFANRRIATGKAPEPGVIFICGMPRSGTSMVEAMLAAHPRVDAGGEQRFIHDHLFQALGGTQDKTGEWLRHKSDDELRDIAHQWHARLSETAGSGAFVTDKMPGNYSLLGLIHVCFPDAPIIHVRRDPRDTCLSCFATPFSEGNAFSADLADAGHYYRLYERLMQHWRETLGPGRIIEVEYEKLVREPETEIRRLLEAVGLDWDERCLEFHNAGHTVRTASFAQVRRPLYSNSIGRWHRFEKHLDPLIKELKAPLVP